MKFSIFYGNTSDLCPGLGGTEVILNCLTLPEIRAMNILLLVLSVSISLNAFSQQADDFWIFISDKVEKGSMASRSQLRQIHEVVIDEINSSRSNEDSFRNVNKKLSSLGLPQVITNSENLRIYPAYFSGVVSSSNVGMEIRDGVHRYCFPCQIGHNSYMIGVIKYEMSVRNSEGRYFPILKCFENIQSGYLDSLSGYVNSNNWPQKRFLSAAIDDGKHQGVLIVTDEEANFYKYSFPNEYYSFQQFKLHDGRIIELRWDSNDYGRSHQPSFKENPQFSPTKWWQFWKSDESIMASKGISDVERDAMIISTLKSQMDKLLGPGKFGYSSPTNEWKCKALKACFQIEDEVFSERNISAEASALLQSWRTNFQELSCSEER